LWNFSPALQYLSMRRTVLPRAKQFRADKEKGGVGGAVKQLALINSAKFRATTIAHGNAKLFPPSRKSVSAKRSRSENRVTINTKTI
jgi:hypothetical protein